MKAIKNFLRWFSILLFAVFSISDDSNLFFLAGNKEYIMKDKELPSYVQFINI